MTHVAMSTVVRGNADTLWNEIGAFERLGSGDFDVPDQERDKTVATIESFFKAGLTSLRGRHG